MRLPRNQRDVQAPAPGAKRIMFYNCKKVPKGYSFTRKYATINYQNGDLDREKSTECGGGREINIERCKLMS